MKIGIPIETKTDEHRVALLPREIKTLTKRGFRCYVPKNLGSSIGLKDQDYRQSGATVLENNQAVYEVCNLIVKVKEPVDEDFRYLGEQHIIFCYCHLASSKELTLKLMQSGCSSYAFEMVKAPDGSLPLLKPMSLIAGKLAADVGMQFNRWPYGKRGIMSGFKESAMQALIFGAGNAGLAAAQRLLALDVNVQIFENNPSLVLKLSQNPIWKNRIQYWHQDISIQDTLAEKDLVIGATLLPGLHAPSLINKAELSYLPTHAVLVDISIDQGGCFECSVPTTHSHPIHTVDSIIHYAVTNMPSAVPLTASDLLSSAIIPWVKTLASGEYNTALHDSQMTHKGQLVFTPLKKAFNL